MSPALFHRCRLVSFPLGPVILAGFQCKKEQAGRLILAAYYVQVVCLYFRKYSGRFS